jgi:hypothetical protein
VSISKAKLRKILALMAVLAFSTGFAIIAGCGSSEKLEQKSTRPSHEAGPAVAWDQMVEAAKSSNYDLWLSSWAKGTMNVDRTLPLDEQMRQFNEAIDPSLEINRAMYEGKVVDLDVASDRAAVYILVKSGNLAESATEGAEIRPPEVLLVWCVKEDGNWRIVGPHSEAPAETASGE